ncbi:MAG: hypothetical protein RIS47_1248, partial [Bacteroidota bacterium]
MKKNFNMLERKLLIPFYVLLFVFGFLQLSEIQAQNNKVQQVHIDQADVLEGKKDLGPDVKVLKGNVVFSHAGSKMFCDSAYFYSATNSLKAFGKIHITRGDSIQLFGDTLLYSGNDRIARVLNHVVLKNDSLSLFTSELTYFMQQDMGAYSTGGLTINKEDTLRSRIGRYYAQRDIFHFSEKVRVTNPKFRIECDTLKHNTKTQISYFLGPTHIYGDSNYIYCENGWYNHKENKAQFNKNARYESKTYSLRGDSLF